MNAYSVCWGQKNNLFINIYKEKLHDQYGIIFKNHFNTDKISDDDIQKFAEINLQRTSANNDGEEEEPTPPTPKKVKRVSRSVRDTC